MIITEEGIMLTVEEDLQPLHPRNDYENLGVMLCWHKRYSLGDKNQYLMPSDFETDKEMQESIFVRLSVYMFDHSGFNLSTSLEPFKAADPARWDWGQLGAIYATKEAALKEFGDLSEQAQEKAAELLRGEIEHYNNYLSGECYCFKIEDASGNILDGCGSFFGNSMLDILKQMKSCAVSEHHALFDRALKNENIMER